MRRWVRCSGMVIHADGVTMLKMGYNHEDEEMRCWKIANTNWEREELKSHWGKTPIAHVSQTMLDASTIRSNRVIDAMNANFFFFFIGVSWSNGRTVINSVLEPRDSRKSRGPVQSVAMDERAEHTASAWTRWTGQKTVSLSSDYIQLWKAKNGSSLPWIFNVKLSLMSFVGFWTFNCEIKINK